MSSSAVLQHDDVQANMALLANPPGMVELTDEDLTQVAGAEGWDMGRMRRMREAYCERRCDRRIRFSLTRLHVEYRLDFVHYGLKVD